MATRTALRGTNLNHPTYYWHDPSTWSEGVVPNSGDTVTVSGYQTTINQANIYSWSGNINIIVASTTNFPPSGSFYTTTFFGKKIKIDYTGILSNTFTGCTIDQTYQIFDNSTLNGSYIPNVTYVHSPAPYIIIDSGITANAGILTITAGGWLQINSGGIFNNYEYVELRDGNFKMNDRSTFVFMRNKNLNRFIISNYPMQYFYVYGNELRTNTTTTEETLINSYRIKCSNPSKFSVGDKISIYNKDYYPFVKNFNSWCPPGTYPSGTQSYVIETIGNSGTTYDEGLDVIYISSNYLYFKPRNGIESKVFEQSDDYSIIVDEQRFKIGDKIVMVDGENMQSSTITNIEDYDYLLRDYNFANGDTLNDWTTDTSSGFTYYANFSTDGTKMLHTTSTANNIFIKDLWLNNVKIEAWMSPLDQITGGTRSNNYFGLMISNDPTSDKYIIETINKCTYFYINDSTNQTGFNYKNYTGNVANLTSYPTTYLPLYTGNTLRDDCRTLAKYTLEVRNGFTKIWVNDHLSGGFNPIFEKFNFIDTQKGRIGIFTNNSSFTCTRFKVYSTCQKITLSDSVSSFSVPDWKIYQTGNEYYHPSGCTVLKIGSIITDLKGHFNYAYAYQGATNGYFPYIKGVNSNNNTTISTSSNIVLNQNLYPSFVDITSGADKYIVIDLLRQVEFSHISFSSFYDFNSVTNTITFVQIWGSNDSTTWVEIYAKTADNKLASIAPRLRYYPCGTRNYRYIKFGVSGNSASTNNRIVNVGVHNYSSGYTLGLNNTSDFNVGDKIMIGSKNSYYYEYYDHFYTAIAGGTKVKSDYISGLQMYYDIIGKTGNTIALDRPFSHGYLDGGELIWKVNRNTKFLGFTTAALYTRGNIYSLEGSSYPRTIKMYNVELDQVGTDHTYVPGTLSTQYKGGLSFCSYDDRSPIILDGISFHDSYIGSNGYFGSYYSSICYRNCYLSNFYYNYCYNTYGIKILYNSIISDVVQPIYNESGRQVHSMYNFYYNVDTLYQLIYLTNNYGMLFYQDDQSKIIRNYAGNVATTFINYTNAMYNSPYTSKYLLVKDNFVQSPTYISTHAGIEKNDIENIYFNYTDSGHKINSNIPIAYNIYGTNNFNWFTNIMKIKDYNRYGYSITYGYNTYYIKYPNETFIRVYKSDIYNYFPIIGMAICLNKNVNVKISIQFLYRHSLDQVASTSNFNNSSALTMNIIKDGIIVFTYVLVKTKNWMKFDYTFNLNEIGYYYITFGQAIYNGRLDLKNISSVVFTDNPNDIEILGNNLNDNILMNSREYLKSSSPIIQDVNKKIRIGYNPLSTT